LGHSPDAAFAGIDEGRRVEARSEDMANKMKTDKGAKARFKVTGTGRLRRRHAFTSHLLEKKPSRRMRRLHREVDVAPGDAKRMRRLLGR